MRRLRFKLFRALVLSGVSALALSACKTLDNTAQSVCARKAALIGAAQATIDALNKACPLVEATAPEGNQ